MSRKIELAVYVCGCFFFRNLTYDNLQLRASRPARALRRIRNEKPKNRRMDTDVPIPAEFNLRTIRECGPNVGYSKAAKTLS